jgi:short-subunit dehydrogenase
MWKDRLKEVIYILEKYPHANIYTSICNVLDKEDVKRFAHDVKQNLGNVDMLINNAGQGRVSNFENTQDEDWMKEIELKYFSVLHPVRAFLNDLNTLSKITKWLSIFLNLLSAS